MTAAARLRAAIRGGPLADANFRLLTGGQLASTVGDYCYAVALPWLVLSGGGGPARLGVVLACYGVPRVAALPAGGVLADRLGPRRVMLVADVVRAILAGLLVLVAARHTSALAVLAPIAVGLGAGEGLFLPASSSIMPVLLGSDRLAGGNAINMAALQFGTILGPVLGGAMVAAGGSVPAFAVDAASFAVSAVTLALIRLGRAAAAQKATAEGAAADADAEVPPAEAPEAGSGFWEFVRRERMLKLLMLISLVANFGAAGTFEVALPTLAHARWGAGGYGSLIACIGVGTIIGTLASAAKSRLRRPAIGAGLALLVCAAGIAAIPFLGGLAGAAAAALLLGVGLGFGNTVLITLAQQWVPADLLGRVMSLVMMCSIGSYPISTALTGVLVHVFGPSPFFVIAGIAVAVASLVALSQPVFRGFGAARAESAQQLAPSAT